MNRSSPRIAIVGAGAVGSTIAYACLLRGVARHVALYDANDARVRAEVLDLNHGLQFVPSADVVGRSDISVCRDADVVVIAAGTKQQPGQSRRDLAAANARTCLSLAPQLLAIAPHAVYLLVTNPVDVLTQLFQAHTALPPGRLMGTGTVLDSSRFRFLLAERARVAVANVHAYVVGEHGDSEIPLWSGVTIGGVPLQEWSAGRAEGLGEADREALFETVRTAAYRIIEGKGATNYAIGLAAARILAAILDDERRILPVSAPVGDFPGLEGLEDVCLSLPRIVDGHGAGAPLPVPMTPDERAGLRASAQAIRDSVRALTA